LLLFGDRKIKLDEVDVRLDQQMLIVIDLRHKDIVFFFSTKLIDRLNYHSVLLTIVKKMVSPGLDKR